MDGLVDGLVGDMKNCLFCTHFFYMTGQPDYSVMTPGCEVEIGCGLSRGGKNASKWELQSTMDSEDDFRRKMTTAETCEDYEKRDG